MRHGGSRFVCVRARLLALVSHPRQLSIRSSRDRMMRSEATNDAARNAAAYRGRRGRRWRVAPSISRVEARWSCRRSCRRTGPTPACHPWSPCRSRRRRTRRPHELANRAPVWIVINIHDRVCRHRNSSW